MNHVARIVAWCVANPTKRGLFVSRNTVRRNLALQTATEILNELGVDFRLRLSATTIDFPGAGGSLRFTTLDPNPIRGSEFQEIVIDAPDARPETLAMIMSRKR